MISRIDAHRRAWVEAYQQNAQLNDPWAALEVQARAYDIPTFGPGNRGLVIGGIAAAVLWIPLAVAVWAFWTGTPS